MAAACARARAAAAAGARGGAGNGGGAGRRRPRARAQSPPAAAEAGGMAGAASGGSGAELSARARVAGRREWSDKRRARPQRVEQRRGQHLQQRQPPLAQQQRHLLQQRGERNRPGVPPQPLLRAAAAAPLALAGASPATGEPLVDHFVFLCGFMGWFVAQFSKIFTHLFTKGVLDLRQFVASGGMPSSHSGLCVGITTAIAIQYGTAGALFPLSLGFSLIVMYDACNVRRHAGHTAEVLNKVVDELFKGHELNARYLKEILGHTPLQVFFGMITGVVSAFACKMVVGI